MVTTSKALPVGWVFDREPLSFPLFRDPDSLLRSKNKSLFFRATEPQTVPWDES